MSLSEIPVPDGQQHLRVRGGRQGGSCVPAAGPDLVAKDEAVKILPVTPRTLTNLVARGELTAYRRAGSTSNYYDVAELQDLALPKPVER